jgi:hypothetical protein
MLDSGVIEPFQVLNVPLLLGRQQVLNSVQARGESIL